MQQRIKPLIWEEWKGPKIGRYAKAKTPFGDYFIFHEDDFVTAEFHPPHDFCEDDTVFDTVFRTLDTPLSATFFEAKNACENEFNSFVLECLE